MSGQNHLERHNERGKKTRQTEEEVGRQHQGMDRPGVCLVPEGSRELGNMEESVCKIICGVPTTLAAKELIMMKTGTDRMNAASFMQSLSLKRKFLLQTQNSSGFVF